MVHLQKLTTEFLYKKNRWTLFALRIFAIFFIRCLFFSQSFFFRYFAFRTLFFRFFMNSLKDAFAITKFAEFFSLKYTFAIKPFAQRTPYRLFHLIHCLNESFWRGSNKYNCRSLIMIVPMHRIHHVANCRIAYSTSVLIV